MNLNLPSISLQIKTEKNKNYIFDIIRKKYVVLSPEEYVRQHLIHYLISLEYPAALISVERSLPQSNQRYDIVVYGNTGKPVLIVECKAPMQNINERVTNQVSSYLFQLPTPYFLISNGLEHHFYGRSGAIINKYQQIPKFSTLSH